MADATLTLPGGNARPALPAALAAAPTILALDLGTTTGWALRAHDGLITSGTVSFRPSRYDGGGMRYLRFTNWLTELDQLSGPIAAIWYEEVRRHVGTDAAHVYGGLMATLTAWAELRGVPYQGVPVGTVKKHATGTGNAGKSAMVAAARARVQPERRQRGGRDRHPALGYRDPRRCPVKGEVMLRQAARVVGQRRRAYGDPAASMATVAARWSITLGQPVTAAQVVLCLIDLKLARLGHDPAHADSILDVAGYAAVLQEVRS
jgi:Domain of unknown function (DUF6378)